MRFWAMRAAVVAALALASAPGALPAFAAAAADSVEERASQAMWWGDLDAVQALYDHARGSHERDTNGDREIDGFRAGLDRTLRGDDADGVAFCTQLVELTRQYAQAHPSSALAHTLVARALRSRAWAARGGDYAAKVPAPAMAAFTKDIRAAEKYFEEHASVALTDPTSHSYLLSIGRSAGWSLDKQWALLEDSLRIDPDDLDIYAFMITSALPKWGGSPAAIDAVVQDAVQRTRPTWGTAMYARLYVNVAQEFDGGLFRQTMARWDAMKQGFDDLLARYPGPLNVNRYAMVACLAEDRPVATKLLRDIGDAPVYTAWARGDRGEQRYDACRRWVREGGEKK